MDPATLYVAVAVGALALYGVLRPGRASLRAMAGLIGLAAFAWLLGMLPSLMSDSISTGDDGRPPVLFIIFSLIAVASAGRMITHPRPVYSALYFVLVVVSSAGMFLLLAAEFMAFALVIVYAGAILVTYMFVIMLAEQATDPDHPEGQPTYDRIPREAAAAVTVGFIMLALLTTNATQLKESLPIVPPQSVDAIAGWQDLQQMPLRLERLVEDHYRDEGLDVPDFELGWAESDSEERTLLYVGADGTGASALITLGDGEQQSIGLDETAIPGNVQRVGLSLVADFPVSLELAGIILLMAMFGAVVMARRQIELGEDEVRQAAGLAPAALDAADDAAAENDNQGGTSA